MTENLRMKIIHHITSYEMLATKTASSVQCPSFHKWLIYYVPLHLATKYRKSFYFKKSWTNNTSSTDYEHIICL